jgi:hypothetical protein
MPLLDRRRRNRKRAMWVLAAGVVTLVVVSSIVVVSHQVDKASGPYETSVNRSFGDQARLVVDTSNTTGAQMRQLLASASATGSSLQRAQLQQQLDALAIDANEQAQSASLLASPATTPAVGGQFASVMSQRAQAMSQIQQTLEGSLGMGMLPLVGSPSSPTASTSTAVLAPSVAAQRLVAAGSELAAADATFATLRARLKAGPGKVSLPASAWVAPPTVWSLGGVTYLVNAVTTSKSLAVANHLVLQTVGITPTAVPPTNPLPAGTSVLPPTYTLGVAPVLRNGGDVSEDGIQVTVSLTPTSGANATETMTRTVSILPDASAALDFSLPVYPGNTYTLNVTAVLPPAPTPRSNPSVIYTLVISQAAPLVPIGS